jgi:hypothetical protein
VAGLVDRLAPEDVGTGGLLLYALGRVLRFELGNLDDHKASATASGRRASTSVLGIGSTLLCGGDKATQAKDIKQAKAYWKQYLKEQHNGQA